MTAPTTVPAPPLPALSDPWSVRPARPDGDAELLRCWMSRPHVAEYWQQAWPADAWARELDRQLTGDHSLPLLVASGGSPVAYLEVYRVLRDRLAGHYREHPHDLGVHVAIGEASRTGQGLGRTLLRAVAEGLLAADERCRRVVAEPDVRNVRSIRAFTAAGFRPAGLITLPDKTAALLVFDRNHVDHLDRHHEVGHDVHRNGVRRDHAERGGVDGWQGGDRNRVDPEEVR